MSLSRTETGVVIAKRGNHLTIRLTPGQTVKVEVLQTHMSIGSECQVAFDNSSGEIVNVIDCNDIAACPEATSEAECPSPEELEEEFWEWSVLGGQEGDYGEFGEQECSRDPEF